MRTAVTSTKAIVSASSTTRVPGCGGVALDRVAHASALAKNSPDSTRSDGDAGHRARSPGGGRVGELAGRAGHPAELGDVGRDAR